MDSKKILATLLLNGPTVNGVGVTTDNRSVVSTLKDDNIIKTELYNNNAANCFDWIMNKTNLLQKYLLLRLYRAKQADDTAELHPNSPEHHVLQNLPAKPYNVKAMIEKYLLKSCPPASKNK